MGCSKMAKGSARRLVTTSTVEAFEPFTEWMPAIGIDAVKMVIKRKSVQLAGTSPTFNVKPAIQVATVRPDNPGTWATISANQGNPYAGQGEDNTGVLNIASTTAGQAFVRFGVSYYLGGTTPTHGQADVEVQASYVQCGSVVGAMTQELSAVNTTSDVWVAVTGWVPAMDIDKVVAQFVLSDLTGSFRCRLGYRKATTNTQTPSAWSSLEGTPHDANGETTSGEITINDLGGEMLAQFGVGYSQASASSTPGQATVSVSVAVRRS